MRAEFDDETWRYILLPVYLASYRYGDQTYQVMANGQTGEIAGQKPVAWLKIWLAVTALLLPGLLMGIIGLSGEKVLLTVCALFLLILGGAAAVSLYRKAVESEAL